MKYAERIELRNKLFNKLIELKLVLIYSNKKCILTRNYKEKMEKALNYDLELKSMYHKYMNEFQSSDEALYCLIHQDDFENHICPVCKNTCSFYVNNYRKEYKITCGNNECVQTLASTGEAKTKIKKTKSLKYGDENYNNRQKAEQTCIKKYKAPHPMKNPDVVDKGKKTRKEKYGDENYNNRQKAEQTCVARYNAKNPMKIEKFKNKLQNTNKKKYGYKNAMKCKFIAKKCKNSYIKNRNSSVVCVSKYVQSIINIIGNNLSLFDIYYNDELFKQFITLLYNHKNEPLRINDITSIFNRKIAIIGQKIHNLKLEKYFFIQNSKLEIKFKDFLNKNNIKYKWQKFCLETKNNTKQQIDFILSDYNIGFEINDVGGHNIIRKPDCTYHVNKTKMLKDQHNMRLIHLWEWELVDENLWRRTSNWILNLLNPSKIQLPLSDCNIKEIPLEEQKRFLNEFNLNGYTKSDYCIGLYHNSDLIQALSFNDNELNLCVKFGYNIVDGTVEVIKSLAQKNNLNLVIVKCDLSKFTGKTLEQLGFKLIDNVAPQKISFDKNEISDYYKMFDCGKNIFVL